MRKLGWAAAGFAAAALSAFYLPPGGWLPVAAVAAALLALLALLLPLPSGWQRRKRLPAVIALCAAALGLLWCRGYDALFLQPAEAFVGEKRTVTVRLTEYPEVYEEYSRVKAVSVDDTLPHVRMLIYDYGAGMTELRPGDEVEMPLKLLSARTYYGEASKHYLADGIQLRAYLADDYAVTGRGAFSWLYFPQEIARVIREQTLKCFPADVGPLMKALLTGDRTEYYLDDGLYSAMKTAGFVHIIAVSGMHVAFLVSLLRLLTGRRRITALLGVPMIVVFMAMIGFTPSVTRAGLMQIILLLAPLLRREEDPPTSLAFALLVLLLANPYAAGSLGLQLSFAAMAGLCLITPRIYGWLSFDGQGKYRLPHQKLTGGALRWIFAAFSASVGASVFTTPIAALYFGYVPLYSILTNLLCLWAMSTAFFCGYFVCLAGLLSATVGTAAGWIAGWLPRYAIWIVKRIARWPMAALYTRRNLGGWWLIFVYLLFAGTYLLRGKGRYRPVIPVCLALSTLSLVTFTLRADLRGKLEVAAVDVGQGACTVAMTETGVAMIDCGSTGSAANAGERAADFLLQNGRNRVDLLVLTHFHADHVNGVRRLMSRVDVERLVIAAALEENEYSEGILAECARAGTQVYLIDEDQTFTLDDLSLTVYAPLGVGDINESCLLIYGDYGDFEFLVTGDAGGDVERLLTVLHDLGDMELLLVGHHGSKYSTSEYLLDDIRPELAFISVGEGNSYGHPAPEVLERLEERGIEIRRTDLEGTVAVIVGSEDQNGESEKNGV